MAIGDEVTAATINADQDVKDAAVTRGLVDTTKLEADIAVHKQAAAAVCSVCVFRAASGGRVDERRSMSPLVRRRVLRTCAD